MNNDNVIQVDFKRLGITDADIETLDGCFDKMAGLASQLLKMHEDNAFVHDNLDDLISMLAEAKVDLLKFKKEII